MPYTVNGIGTTIVPSRGYVDWGGQDEYDCDALECVVFAYMPLLPYKALHTHGWQGTQYRAHPIRWSLGLVLKGFAWRWLKLLYVIFGCLVFFGTIETYEGLSRGGLDHARTAEGGLALGVALGFGLFSYGIRLVLLRFDRRDQDIRFVLGPHQQGSSDPGTWPADMAAAFKTPQELHGTSRYVDAVDGLLGNHEFSSAMWAARIEVARGDATRGEQATDRILAHPRVREALAQVRAEPARWRELLAGPPAGAPAEPPAAAEAVP